MTTPSTPESGPDLAAQKFISSIANQFAIEGEFLCAEEIKSGHINSTYRVTYQLEDGLTVRYIIQCINHFVFKQPNVVMKNVERVTRHINNKVLRIKKGLGGQTLNLFPTRKGSHSVEDNDGNVWRCYNNIEGCVTYDVVENTRQAYQAAHAFGSFQNLVSDMDASKILETIPNFHNTRQRYNRLIEVATADAMNRAHLVENELNFIRDREHLVDVLLQLQAEGKIPTRVTHNDTKINNVMIDAESDEAVCVIDLDTVMPGLALYDFGDLVRSATSPAAEDETDLSLVSMQMSMFEALVQGYLDAAGEFLNETEINHLVHSSKLMCLEVGIRFLTDFLEGDVYFKTHRDLHNLDRCRNQLQLVRSIEKQEPEMISFVKKVRRSRA